MESIKAAQLHDEDISKAIREIVEESSYLKSKIFKSLITVGELDPTIPKSYKNFVNDFIKIWEDYSKDLATKIKGAKGAANIYTVNYNYAKDFIYAKDDYASVLQFANGVIQGIKTKKFTNPEYVEDFFKFTVGEAFHDKGSSVAALLDSVLSRGIVVDMYGNTSASDAKMFDSAKTYNMFKETDATELKKSIDKVIDYICNELDEVVKELKYRDVKMFVAMINNIVEYITYSLAVYATRIYLISRYAYPFINNHDGASYMNAPVAISESVMESNGELKPRLGEFDISISIMHGASELLCRDYSKVKEYIGILDTFCKAIGANTLFGANKPKIDKWGYIPSHIINNDNAFVSNLMGNPLYEYLICDDSWPSTCSKDYATEMNHVLKEYVYNNTQAHPGSYTPKQELLYIIRGAHHENTIDGYKRLVKDMYLAAAIILTNISYIINMVDNWQKERSMTINTASINNAGENLKILKDLYAEIAVAFMHKGRDIELHFNVLKKSEINKLEDDLSIKIPNYKPDLDSNINMMNSVPDTTRVSYDILDLYDLPTFESLEMYDDYLRSLPGMMDDDYLSEAVGLSSIINAIFSRVKSIFNRFSAFIKDKRFEAGRKWVIDHSNDILSMDYNGKELYVLPYKKNITLPAGYDNLIKNLNNFNEKVMETEESKEAFIKSLYPNETIYNWFTGKDNNESGPEMYRNHILFYDLNETKNEVPSAVSISGNTLHAAVNNWITTMRQAPDTLNEFKRIKDQIESAVNNVKSKMITMENSAKQDDINKQNEMPKVDESDKNVQEGEAKAIEVPPTDGGNKSASNNKSLNGNETFLMEIQTAIMRLWGSLSSIFIHCFLTEYKYIKDAYSVGRKNSN